MLACFFVGIALIFGHFASPGFLPQARSTIEGRVTSTNNRPVSDVRILLLTDTYSPVKSDITDGSGRFRFTNVFTGSYYVQVEPTGTNYERQSQRVDVNPFNIKRAPSGDVVGGGEIFRVDIILRMPNNPALTGSGGVVFNQDVPEAAKKEFLNGARSLDRDDFTSAAVSLKRAIEIFPDYYDALELLGDKHVEREEYEAALPFLKHAVEVNKDGWRSFYALGVALLELKQRSDGIEALRRAVELNPNSINANMRLGMTLAQSETTRADAIKALHRVAHIDKGKQVPQVYYYLAALYDKNQQYKESADALESFLQTVSQSETEKREKLKKMIAERRQKAAGGSVKN